MIDRTSTPSQEESRPARDPSLSNSLTDLAARIRAEHEAASDALTDSVRHAIEAGLLLIEAKAQLPHGEWLPWLREHCTISERTAQVYMRCAKNREAIEDQIRSGAADLSLNEAAALLMLSSDVRKLLELTKTMAALQGEELVSFCAANDIGMLKGNLFDAPEPTNQERVEWLIFVLWLVKRAGWCVEGAFAHMDWVQSRGTMLSEWMAPHPILDSWRKPIGKEALDDWNAFLEVNRGRSCDDVNAEIKKIMKAQELMPVLPRDTRKKRPKRLHHLRGS